MGAPKAHRVVFIVLLREPASRVLSSMYFYASSASSSAPKSRVAQLEYVRRWVAGTPCSNYTAEGVKQLMSALGRAAHRPVSHPGAPMFATFGVSRRGSNRRIPYPLLTSGLPTAQAGLLFNEYSHFFGVRDASDVAAALARLCREFVVGLLESITTLVDLLARFVSPSQRDVLARRMRALIRRPTRAGKGASNTLPYCSASDLPAAVVAGVAKLTGTDVALYEGAKAVHREQLVAGASLPASDFAATFRGREQCEKALAPHERSTGAARPSARAEPGLLDPPIASILKLGVVVLLLLVLAVNNC